MIHAISVVGNLCDCPAISLVMQATGRGWKPQQCGRASASASFRAARQLLTRLPGTGRRCTAAHHVSAPLKQGPNCLSHSLTAYRTMTATGSKPQDAMVHFIEIAKPSM